MDDSEDELSDAPILLADKQGQPEERGKGEDRYATSGENKGSEKLTNCCKVVFSCCNSYLQGKRITRYVEIEQILVKRGVDNGI